MIRRSYVCLMAVIMAVLAVLLARPRCGRTQGDFARGARLIGRSIDDYSRQTGQKFASPSAPPGNCATSSRRAGRPTSSSYRRR